MVKVKKIGGCLEIRISESDINLIKSGHIVGKGINRFSDVDIINLIYETPRP